MPVDRQSESVSLSIRENKIDLRGYLQALLRYKWIIVGMFLVAVIAAYIFSSLDTPIYEATTTILIQDPQASGEYALFEAMSGNSKNTNQNYLEVLKSRTLAKRAMQKLGYSYDMHSPEFAGFQAGISVELVAGTDAIRIHVVGTDRDEVSRRANAVVEAFSDLTQEVNTGEARSARDFIEKQLSVVESDLHKAESALRQYKEKEKVVAPTEEAKTILGQLSELEKNKAEATVAISQVQRQLTDLRKRIKSEARTTVASTTIAENPMVLQYKGRLFELESQLSSMRTQYENNHPKIDAINAEITAVRQKLSQEVERTVASETMTANPSYQALLQQIVSLEVENLAQTAKQEALQKQINVVDKTLSSLPSKEEQLTRLVRNQNVAEQVYLLLKNKREEYRISEAMNTSGVSVVDLAIPPDGPIRPDKKLNMLIAGFLGVLMGLGLVFVLEFLDNTFKSAQDVEDYLGLPIVGSVPEMISNSKTRSYLNKGMKQV